MAVGVLLSLGCVRAPTTSVRLSPDLQAAQGLTDLDGRPVDLPALVAAKDATVLSFFSTTCPCVLRYQARTEALGAQDPARVQVLYMSSNANEDAAGLRAAVLERGLRLPLVVDWKGTLAQALGARSTPTAVLLDRSGAVRFVGWQDNERLPGEPDREPYLERAIAGVLSGAADFAVSSPTYGCLITKTIGGHAAACRVPPSPAAP